MDLRTGIPALVVSVGCSALVTLKVATAPVPPAPRQATVDERVQAAMEVRASESGWRDETTRNFPSDLWSQRDDFHGREYRKVLDLAKDKGIRIEDVLRGIDDDIHRQRARTTDVPDDRNARAIPCKPRPFYD